ncbi:MAG: FAD-dependent oxidoreductase [Enterobacter hormaechei]
MLATLYNNVALAASGIPYARGIVVDHQMQTSVPDIYAIGECCKSALGLAGALLGAGGYSSTALAGRSLRRHPEQTRRAS